MIYLEMVSTMLEHLKSRYDVVCTLLLLLQNIHRNGFIKNIFGKFLLGVNKI